HDLRNVTDEDIERENKIFRVAGLPEVAVDSGFDLDARPGVNVDAVGDHGSDGAEGVEAFAAHPLRLFALQIAGGEIIYAGVAEDVGAYVIARGEPVAAAGDHDSQFALIVGVRGSLGPKNRSARRQQGRGRFEKQQRLLRNFVAKFGGVLAIVAADADDLRGAYRRQ